LFSGEGPHLAESEREEGRRLLCDFRLISEKLLNNSLVAGGGLLSAEE
jgi:hypothetical protein